MKQRIRPLSTRRLIEDADKLFHEIRWDYGIVWCPYCGCMEVIDYGDYHYRCRRCHNRFTDRTRTIMHNSKLPTKIWMQAIYEILHTNFISGYELADKLGVTQKTAWFMHSKIAMYMKLDEIRLHGIVSMDEVYIGCHMSNMHLRRKLKLLEDSGLIKKGERYSKDELYTLNSEIKQHVYGLTDGDKVVLQVCPNPIVKEYIYQIHRKHCGSDVITVSDDSRLYRSWSKDIGEIHTNNHSKHQYVSPDGFSSNPIENVFSWTERGYAARMTHSKRLQLYLNEFCFRRNTRDKSTKDRIREIVHNSIGHPITRKDLMEYNQFSWVKHNPTKEKDDRELEVIREMFKRGVLSEAEYKHRIYTREDFLD